jgi:hypothetical protein
VTSLPLQVDDASAWTAADFPAPRAWVRALGNDQLAELDRLATAGEDKPPRDGGPPAAPPALRELLASCAIDLERGPGFAVLAGFPVDRYGYDGSRRAFLALLRELGSIMPQTRDGATVIDVIDRERPYDHTSRGYHSNRLLPFHTDGAHCVALLCLDQAHRGGASVIVSAASAHNAVLGERPDLWQVLARGFHHHRRGEHGAGESPLSANPIPVFGFHDGLLHCMYNRNPIEWAEREGVRLTPLDREALDYLDSVLARPALQLAMELEPGDVQILNNFTILHSRTEFEDRPPRRRHLLRVWLELPGSRRRGPTLLDIYRPAEPPR